VQCQAGTGGNQPTVAKLTLYQIMTAHSLDEQMWISAQFLQCKQAGDGSKAKKISQFWCALASTHIE